MRYYLHRIDSPDDDGEATNGTVEVANLTTLATSCLTAVDDELPDDDEIGDAGNGIPAPLLAGALGAKGSKETSQNHDDISDDGNEHAATARTSKQEQVDEQEWCSEGPVNVACPVDFAEDVLVGVWDVLVLLLHDDVVVADAVASSHGEVGQGGKDDDHRGDDVVEALGLCRVLAWSRLVHAECEGLTIGTLHDMPVKTIEATSMMTKTTLSDG